VVEQTAPGTMLGSPNYVSPEQAAGDSSVDHRSDLWSMAVVLYQMVTGVLPFRGPSMGSVLKKVFMEAPPRIADVAPDLPSELDAFFDKALAKRRTERFATIDEMVRAFLEIAAPDLEAPQSSLRVPSCLTAQAGEATPESSRAPVVPAWAAASTSPTPSPRCSEPDAVPTVQQRCLPQPVSAAAASPPADRPDSGAAKGVMGRSAWSRRARPWLFAAATLVAAAALILRVTADTGPDIHPSVVLQDELPRPLPSTFVPSQGAAAISPETEPPTAAPRETKPASASTAGRGAPQDRPAETQPAVPAPPTVDNASPKPAPSPPPPDARPSSPAAFTPDPAPTPAPAAPADPLEKRWF
jgi:serine/threonine protein kinase